MAKRNGGTRKNIITASTNAGNGLRAYRSWGDKSISVQMEEGFPVDRAQEILEQLERLSDIYEIPVNGVVLMNKKNTRVGAAATTDQEEGILKFSLSNGGARTTYSSNTQGTVSHEFAHLFPDAFEKPTPPLMTRERAPKLWAKYERRIALYEKNKRTNDEMVRVYKDFKREAKRIGNSDLYAVQGGVGEFAAEAFAYRIRYGAGRMEHFDKAYNLLLKLKK